MGFDFFKAFKSPEESLFIPILIISIISLALPLINLYFFQFASYDDFQLWGAAGCSAAALSLLFVIKFMPKPPIPLPVDPPYLIIMRLIMVILLAIGFILNIYVIFTTLSLEELLKNNPELLSAITIYFGNFMQSSEVQEGQGAVDEGTLEMQKLFEMGCSVANQLGLGGIFGC